uniref:Uncharacterized protein LOC108044343 n=1 Tax=Drosophila rhopaloa TaxID=1041015 RepID=A0A6P4EUP8_DRORH
MSIICLTFLCLCLSFALALHIPPHNCDKYFRYSTVDNGNTFIGICTAPLVPTLNFYWKATFEVQEYHGMFLSALQPYPNREEAGISFLKGEPVQAYVRFVNITTELPKLYSLILNGNELCSNIGYPLPRTRASAEHHMSINLKRGDSSQESTPNYKMDIERV